MTAWTNGHQIWCTTAGQYHTWPAAGIDTVAAALADLAPPELLTNRADLRFPGPPRKAGRGPWRDRTAGAGLEA